MTKFVALNRYETPPSPDYGNYLTQVDIINGHDLRGYGLRYNPLFFLLLDVVLKFFDEFTALKVTASLVFSIIGVPFFLLVRKLSSSNLAGLISTWFFVFFEGFSEMIAWGGNPNFLGFSFMLLTLFFLFSAMEEPSKKNILLTGFFLSLVIGTHFLVAFFLIFSLLLFIILAYIFNRRSRSTIVKVLLASSFVGVVFSLPYCLVYQTFLTQSSTDLFRLDFLRQVSELAYGLSWMFRTQALVMVIIAALGIFALSRYFKENKNIGLALTCLFLAPFLLALFTEEPGRWFLFLPIPMMLCFGLYLKNLFIAIKEARKEILLLTLCFILIISADTTVSSISRLEGAIDYYQTIGNDEIQALTWIKENTASNAVFATSGPSKFSVGETGQGNCYGWWIEGFSERKSIFTSLPKWYTYKDERQQVLTANRIFAGTYIFEDCNIRVSEAFPASMSNPEIATLIDGDYHNLLHLNDGELELVFSPIENDQVIWHDAPFYAKNKMMNIFCNGTWVNATFTYEWDRMRLIRSLIMGEDRSSVDLVFKIYPSNVLLKQFNVRIWASYFTSLEDYQIENSTIILYQRLLINQLVKAKITLLDTDGGLNYTEVLPKDPKYSMPVAIYSFKPMQDNSLYVRIRLSIISNTVTEDQTIRFYNSYELINDAKINYIFLNKARIKEYHRFNSDPKHFIKVFENETIVIFRVMVSEDS